MLGKRVCFLFACRILYLRKQDGLKIASLGINHLVGGHQKAACFGLFPHSMYGQPKRDSCLIPFRSTQLYLDECILTRKGHTERISDSGGRGADTHSRECVPPFHPSCVCITHPFICGPSVRGCSPAGILSLVNQSALASGW
jgi:hypothetical protein